MEFNWKPRSIKEWREFLAQTKNANWMQTWNYAQASFTADYLITRIALIEQQGEPIGMMSVQQIKFGPAQIINLKRGPLWFVEPTQELTVEFAAAFRKEFPKKLFQRLRWMPEIELNSATTARLEKIGFRLRKENFVTALVDLRQPLLEIKKNLQQKWRNCLNKAEKSGIELVVQTSNEHLDSFLKFYNYHQRQKRYQGPSQKFLKAEFSTSEKTKDHFFIWAYVNHFPIAAIAVTCHGSTAAYRIGWNNPEGRKHNAHYALLWKAIEISKQRGHSHFDLGGLLPDEAAGMTHFKNGLNGHEIKLAIFGN